MFFERVAVIGAGLIGGSFALALKEAKRCGHVAGAGRSAANMKLALERGVIDSIEKFLCNSFKSLASVAGLHET